MGDTFIEVKKYAVGEPPTESTINANLAQLQDYVDKHPVAARGVLFIYNFSSRLIVAPRRWVRGMFWIAVANLGLHTGSKRREQLVLTEGTGRSLIAGLKG